MDNEKLFLLFLNMSLTASYIIIMVILIRFFIRKAPKWINFILWSIVGIRLILPISFNGIFSVFSAIPDSKVSTQEIIYSNTPAVRSGVPYMNSMVNPAITESAKQTASSNISFLQIASYIWLIGIAVMIISSIFSYIKMKRKLSEATLLKDNIYQSEKITLPFLLGFIKPRIYIPYTISKEELNHVIAHENAHVARRDYIIKPIFYVILSLHWYNPVVWIAYLLLLRDIELACDEKAIKYMNASERKSYSNALVNLAVKSSKITACPLAFGEVSVKSRVKKALSYKKPLFWIVAATIIMCLIAATCLLANPVKDKQPIEDISQIYGTYHPDKVIYVTPISSFYPFDLSQSPYYTIAENEFSYIVPDPQRKVVIDEPEYELIDLTQEEFDNLFFIGVGSVDISQFESIKRIIISEEHSLFIMDSELWIASFNGDSIWIIYRLQPSEPYYYTWERQDNRMTMDELKTLVAKKGENLSWVDFEEYEHYMTGLNFIKWDVPIDDDYSIWIEESNLEKLPVFICLYRLDSAKQITDDRLDLLSGYVDLEGFLADSDEELRWTYMPHISFVFPATPIKFAVSYHEIKVKVDKGSLYIHNGAEARNDGEEYTYAHGETIYWSPHFGDEYDESDIADSCEIGFTVIEYYQ